METDVLVIGGGVTGAGIFRDLTLRGLNVILVEKQDLNAGASGGNHGLLHSGARYVCSDPEAAVECRSELKILKATAPHCIEDTGGLFVAVEGDDEKYVADFPQYCQRSGIPHRALDVQEARELEPVLSDKAIAAYQVNDASVNPFKLTIENVNDARTRGSVYMNHSCLAGFETDDRGKISAARIRNKATGEETRIQARIYVNASGAWAGEVAAMAGIDIPMVFSKGTLIITANRVTQRVINRLRKASDGDILVPGGVVSILGTTSIRVDDPDKVYPTVAEVDEMVNQGEQMIPQLGSCRYIRAYAGVRPLVSSGSGDDRSVTRGYSLLDHGREGHDNFITITGGKLTTYRLMAEKTCDMVCSKLNCPNQCRTHELDLPATQDGDWSEPGIMGASFFKAKGASDPMLCECEMVPASAVDTIVASLKEGGLTPDLSAIGLRSRIGKGPSRSDADLLFRAGGGSGPKYGQADGRGRDRLAVAHRHGKRENRVLFRIGREERCHCRTRIEQLDRRSSRLNPGVFQRAIARIRTGRRFQRYDFSRKGFFRCVRQCNEIRFTVVFEGGHDRDH
ncbi:MAG: FAD-dependent oxidoreductase, partial [Desulfobacterales bacterium]|nr:FAD-dependent oxidoreductase [Desulfobacterales bacterium]